jgi:hypothetical protein
MSTQRLGGVLIITGLIFAIVASMVFPSEYYTAKDQGARQAIMNANRSGWIATNWLWIAASIVTTIGLFLIALRDRSLLSMAGMGLFSIGSAFWIVYLYLRSLDVSVSDNSLWMEAVFAWLDTVGLALLGIAFLCSDFSNWVGYVNIGYGILFMLVFLLFRTQMYEFFPPQVIYMVALFTSIVVVRRG